MPDCSIWRFGFGISGSCGRVSRAWKTGTTIWTSESTTINCSIRGRESEFAVAGCICYQVSWMSLLCREEHGLQPCKSIILFFRTSLILFAKMKCWKCLEHFCYRCGKRLRADQPYSHFSYPGNGCYKRLFDQETDEDEEWAVVWDYYESWITKFQSPLPLCFRQLAPIKCTLPFFLFRSRILSFAFLFLISFKRLHIWIHWYQFCVNTPPIQQYPPTPLKLTIIFLHKRHGCLYNFFYLST